MGEDRPSYGYTPKMYKPNCICNANENGAKLYHKWLALKEKFESNPVKDNEKELVFRFSELAGLQNEIRAFYESPSEDIAFKTELSVTLVRTESISMANMGGSVLLGKPNSYTLEEAFNVYAELKEHCFDSVKREKSNWFVQLQIFSLKLHSLLAELTRAETWYYHQFKDAWAEEFGINSY